MAATDFGGIFMQVEKWKWLEKSGSLWYQMIEKARRLIERERREVDTSRALFEVSKIESSARMSCLVIITSLWRCDIWSYHCEKLRRLRRDRQQQLTSTSRGKSLGAEYFSFGGLDNSTVSLCVSYE